MADDRKARAVAQEPVAEVTYLSNGVIVDGKIVRYPSVNWLNTDGLKIGSPLYAHPATPAPVEAGVLLDRLIKWDKDYPVNCWNGYAGLKELDKIIADAAALRAQSAPAGGEGGEK